MPIETLEDAIAKVRKRLMVLRMLRLVLSGLIAGAAAACLLTLLGRFAPIPSYRYWALALLAAGVLAGAALAAVRRPGEREAALEMDRQGGLEERIGTALAHRGEETLIARLQREEAVRHAAAFARDAAKLLPVPLNPSRLGALAGLAAALAVLLLWPNPMDDLNRKRQEEKQQIAEQVSLVRDIREELESRKLPSLELDQMKRELDALEQGLKESGTGKEALDQLERAMKKLKEQEERLQKELKLAEQWAKAWEANPALQELGRKLAAADREGLEAALDGLRDQVQAMTPEQKQQLAKALAKLAETAESPDAEAERKLKEALASLAGEAGSEGGLSEQAMKELGEAMAQAMDAQTAQRLLAAQAGQLGGQIAQAGLAAAQQLAAQGAAISPAWGANGLAAGMASAAGTPAAGGAGAGAGSGTGAGAGSGTGAGIGSGTGAGSGAGAGSGTGAGAGSGSGAGSGGSGAGTGSGSRSLVTTPRASAGAGGGSAPQSDAGPVQGSGGDVLQGGSAPAMDGASRPYEDVYAEYESEAAKSLGRSQLPQSMQQLVRDYFTEIQPNR